MLKKLLFSLLLVILAGSMSFGQTQTDTIFCYITNTAVTIDGSADEACWQNAEWYPIEKVWIPFNQVMAEGDFEGRFKVAWDSLYFYLLVEVKDDSLSDDYSDPKSNYWNDDCVEVFLDEDRSKGFHQNNYNAFAYHVSTFYDAIDSDKNNSPINLKQNIQVVMDTIGEDLYLWEMAIKVYNTSFNPATPEPSRVKLVPNKIMGFSVAYCDNDETTQRENFIGSMTMPEANANDNYITADYFGSLKLVDPDYVPPVVSSLPDKSNEVVIQVFPNPAKDLLYINNQFQNSLNYKIYSSSGELLLTGNCEPNQPIHISDLLPGSYVFCANSEDFQFQKLFLIK